MYLLMNEATREQMLVPALLALGCVLFVIWWYVRKAQRKRTFARFAEELGMKYVEQEEEDVPDELENVPMAEDFYYICKYKIVGERDSLKIGIFDLTVFEFKISKNFTYTGLTIQSDKLNLPLFTLKPRNKMEEQIAESRGVQFPDDFEFTKTHRIDAVDVAATRDALNLEFRNLARGDRELALIGNEDTLFMHKYPGHMSIKEIKDALEEGIAFAKALQSK